MNFGLSDSTHDNEYKLFESCTEELINLYGISIKYLITKKINQDKIFGEHSHIEVKEEHRNSQAIFDFYVLPAESENWEGDSFLYSKFGLSSQDVMNVFISRNDMEKIHPELTQRKGNVTIDNLPNGNLVVFDNSKIMEVSNFELTTASHGNNNVFSSDRHKNVYKLTLKSYIYNSDIIDINTPKPIEESIVDDEYGSFGNLESIFNGSSDEQKFKKGLKKSVKINKSDNLKSSERKENLVNKENQSNPFGDL